MNISVSAETGMLDRPAFLLGEVYGPMQEEGKHISWTIEDSISLSEDLKIITESLLIRMKSMIPCWNLTHRTIYYDAQVVSITV